MSETGADLPRTYDDLREMILVRHAMLPKRLAQVARYTIEHPNEVAFGTVASIAATAEVQPSTLVRLAQHLGYSGFSDFQFVFRERLRERPASYQERLSRFGGSGDGLPESVVVAQGVLAAAAESVTRATFGLNGEALEQASLLLSRAGMIYVIAQRRSFPPAVYLGYIFGKLGMKAIVAGSQAGNDEDVLSLAGPSDAALAISFAPYAEKTVEWTHLLSGRGVPIIALTDSGFSPVARSSDVWIEVAEADYEGFRSLSATMALSMSLALAAAKKRRTLER